MQQTQSQKNQNVSNFFDISAYDSNIYDLVKNRSSELEAEAEG